MDNKILISPKVIVDLDAVVFASRETSVHDPNDEIPTVNYALAGYPNNLTAIGEPARILWDALEERSSPAYLKDRYLRRKSGA